MNDDWRYSDERMELRQKAYTVLLGRFGFALDSNGEPLYNMKSIVECCHDWVSQGNSDTNGLVNYFQMNYT
jgi:hypothetical protein